MEGRLVSGTGYGVCDRCHRVVWVAWVLGALPSGEPFGLCASCAPTAPEKARQDDPPRLSAVPSPPA